MTIKTGLGDFDSAWQGLVIHNGLIWAPSGYFYPPGFIYSIQKRTAGLTNSLATKPTTVIRWTMPVRHSV